jgi:hypothetical protein
MTESVVDGVETWSPGRDEGVIDQRTRRIGPRRVLGMEFVDDELETNTPGQFLSGLAGRRAGMSTVICKASTDCSCSGVLAEGGDVHQRGYELLVRQAV